MSGNVVSEPGFESEIRQLNLEIAGWIERADDEIRHFLQWQFEGGSKYFRPLTIWSCYRAIYRGSIPPALIRSA